MVKQVSKLQVSREWTAHHLRANLSRVLNPSVCQNVLAAMQDESTDFADISKLIQGDPYIAAKVVGMANLIGDRKDDLITSIERAVQVLGMEHVRTLMLSVMLAGPLLSVDGNVPRRKDLWRWVLACGVANDLLYQLCNPESVSEEDEKRDPEHLVSGLVLGLGALVLYAGHGKDYAQVLGARLRPTGLAQRESKAMRVTHWQVSLWVLQELNCPAALGSMAQALIDSKPEEDYLMARSVEMIGAWVAGFESAQARAWLADGLPRIGVNPLDIQPQIGPMRKRLRELASVFDVDMSDWKQGAAARLEIIQQAASSLDSLLRDRLTLSESVGMSMRSA